MKEAGLITPGRSHAAWCLLLILVCLFAVRHSQAQQTTATVSTGIKERVASCLACHGVEGRTVADAYYPRIAGKPAPYLTNQLINFREGRRQFPLMIYSVTHLSDEYLREIATWFSGIDAPWPPPAPATISVERLQRGRQLTLQGDPGRGIASCVSCHGEKLTGALGTIPGLLGLPRDYLNAQFGAWRNGLRKAAAPDCMGEVATRLSPEDVDAVAGWLAAQPVPAQSHAAKTLPQPLPAACGSVPSSLTQRGQR